MTMLERLARAITQASGQDPDGVASGRYTIGKLEPDVVYERNWQRNLPVVSNVLYNLKSLDATTVKVISDTPNINWEAWCTVLDALLSETSSGK